MADNIILDDQQQNEILDSAVAEGGSYEILRRRLQELGGELQTATKGLNERRLKEFGRSTMDVAGRIRIRTENNCVARDIVRAGEYLWFGYNVFLGLKRETRIEDVFSLYKLEAREGEFEATPVPLKDTFLDIPAFVQDFDELYKYYKNTRLLHLMEKNGKIMASFQIGEKIDDTRVFRWAIHNDGSITYIDNRGERDVSLPPRQDFEWTRTTREDEVAGLHPHINILDTVFVETVGGDLTIKRENNTQDGLGIYREDVLDKNQALVDSVVEYAKVGQLIIMRILPYREQDFRYFVYNTLTHDVRRIDAIGQACVQLPEDHGIIFPGGYYLQSGVCKMFDSKESGMQFRRTRKSPNGEDVLYVFYDPERGKLALLNYNMIEREVQSPLHGNGYAVYEDGRMVLFEDEAGQPTRIHAMQIWQTPYYSEEFAARAKNGNTVLGRIGNAELVRGISDLYNIVREIEAQRISAALYNKLSADTRKLFDSYFWLKDEKEFHFAPILREIARTGELVLDEYEKVESIRGQSERALQETRLLQRELFNLLVPDSWNNIQEYADGLSRINLQRGRIISLRNLRYMDVEQVNAMEEELKAREAEVSRATAEFLAGEKALLPFSENLVRLDQLIGKAETSAQLAEAAAEVDKMAADLDMLSNLIGTLAFDDVTLQTRIIENISEVFALTNQTRSKLDQRRKMLGGEEAVARFGAQFKLFGQSIASGLSLATDPERCDEELSRLLLQLEELESQFSGYDVFRDDILQKREELLETFESHKQTLLDERQRRAQTLLLSAERILTTFPRRTARFNTIEEINAFFVADPMARKALETADQLRALKDTVKADDVEARFKAARDQALRSLRDKTELYEDGGATVKLGAKHRFSVNTQELDLTILPRENALYLHLTGTDYNEKLVSAELDELRDYWEIFLESETPAVARAEYLAYSYVYAASENRDGLSVDLLHKLLADTGELTKSVRAFAAARYKESYEKGIHDHDAVRILQALVPLGSQAGLLRYAPEARALAILFWNAMQRDQRYAVWPEWAKTCAGVRSVFGRNDDGGGLQQEMEKAFQAFMETGGLEFAPRDVAQAAEFLSQTLAATPQEFICSKYGRALYAALRKRLEASHLWGDFANTQKKLEKMPGQRYGLTLSWIKGLAGEAEFAAYMPYAAEAVALAMLEGSSAVKIQYSEADLFVTVDGLLSAHPHIVEGKLAICLNDYFSRMRWQRRQVVPGFRHYQEVRHKILESERESLRLSEFKPQPLSSFVRNKLIDDVYLPIIGDNLAKQIGAMGDAKRTDLMGLLMLISPPGYGKTTLMEYVAACLGLIFMKINGPALGHSVISLDPAQAPDATSRMELQKLNLALEMGNNVMLYVDDIQHTNPEFLQKFISLCDATRRVEGVWKGRTKTYDMRGKKFCVVMAGNPYTESGEVFKIPDMLANRADVYNLGEVLGGMREAFALSYLENSLTSNPVLAPLAQRDMRDLYHFIDRAMGKPGSASDLSYSYSDAEINEIIAVLERLLKIREVVMLVNRNYIDSAAQSNKYRTEPPFKLQGSYRSMNKLAAQVSAVMNDAELERIMDDFYNGEAQLLTEAAEENLLKLAEIRQRLTPAEAERWDEIKRVFQRNKAFGGSESEVGDRVVAQLIDLVQSVESLKAARATTDNAHNPVADRLEELVQCLQTRQEAVPGKADDRVVSKMAALVEAAQNPKHNKADELMVKQMALLVKSIQAMAQQQQALAEQRQTRLPVPPADGNAVAEQLALLTKVLKAQGAEKAPARKAAAASAGAPADSEAVATVGVKIVDELAKLVRNLDVLSKVTAAGSGGKKLYDTSASKK